MPRESLTKHLIQIQDEVLLLGSMVEQAMRMAVDSLKRRDRSAAREIPKADQRINEKRFAIENFV